MSFLVHWAIVAAALWVAAYLSPASSCASVPALLIAALVLGLVNALVRPILTILTLPITILTLGLFYLVVNGVGVRAGGRARARVRARRLRQRDPRRAAGEHRQLGARRHPQRRALMLSALFRSLGLAADDEARHETETVSPDRRRCSPASAAGARPPAGGLHVPAGPRRVCRPRGQRRRARGDGGAPGHRRRRVAGAGASTWCSCRARHGQPWRRRGLPGGARVRGAGDARGEAAPAARALHGVGPARHHDRRRQRNQPHRQRAAARAQRRDGAAPRVPRRHQRASAEASPRHVGTARSASA